MAVLECNVVTCAHNTDDKCSMDKIEIDGCSAKRSESTCCCSYDKCECGCNEKDKETKALDSLKNVDPKVSISCKAVNCIYNDIKTCKATLVGVVGHLAKNAGQTECATFRCR